MLFLAAALTVATPALPPRPAEAQLQMTVSVRILNGARLHVGAERSEEGEPVHDADIRAADGTRRPARLVEFQ